jgi:hypothetical protein
MAIEREAKLQESYLQYANEQAALNAKREVVRLEQQYAGKGGGG